VSYREQARGEQPERTDETMIRIGDVRELCGQEYVVMRRGRGRAGEERTLYVLGRIRDGVAYPAETRKRSSLLGARLVRRVRLTAPRPGFSGVEVSQ
jgi:hypothetical protein